MTAADTTPPRHSRSADLSALAALFHLTVRQHTHGRRLLVLVFLYLVPCALAVLLRRRMQAQSDMFAAVTAIRR